MPISFKLDHVIEQLLAQTESRRRTLKRLAGVKLSRYAAEDIFPHVIEHKWFLSERLGRDVGLRVAAVDYFENIEPPVSFRTNRDSLPRRLPMMMPFGERA
jgi:hypothetical protein